MDRAEGGGSPPPATSALGQVADLAARGASGELVSSGSGGEIHVFLQEGRIAWASSTRQRRAFTEHLKELTGVDDETIEAVVTECSHARRPFGEGLISSRVATADQVRASLLHQIRMALAAAASETDARTLFLERAHYGHYDRSLTFPLSEVFSDADAALAAARPPAEATSALDAAVEGDPEAALAAVEGFAGAAVLSARGERLRTVGDAARIEAVARLSQPLLQEGQRLSIEMGAGLCHQVHVEVEEGHVLVYTTRRAHLTGPGAWLRVVLVLRDLRNVGLARQRVGALAEGIEAAALG